MKMQPDFDKAHEIYFRLGIIYKQQQKYSESLEVRHSILTSGDQTADQLSSVFQVHHQLAPGPPYGGGHLVPDWPCA